MTMMLTGLGGVPPEAVAAGCPNGWGDLPRNQLKVRAARLDAFGLHVEINGTRAGDLILRQFMSTSSTSRYGYIMLSRQVDAQAAVVMVTGAPPPPPLPFEPGPVATPATQQVKVPSNTVFPGAALEFRAPTRTRLGLGELGDATPAQDTDFAQLTLPGPKAYRVGDTGELLLPIEDLPVSADLILSGWCGQEIWRASKGVLRATKEASPEAKLEAQRRAEDELAERQRLEQVALAAWNLAKAMADSARKEAERKEQLAKAAKEPDEKLKLKAEAEAAAGRAGQAELEANLRKAAAEAQKKARDKAQKARDKAKKDVDVVQGEVSGTGMSLGTKLAIGGGLLALLVVLLRRG